MKQQLDIWDIATITFDTAADKALCSYLRISICFKKIPYPLSRATGQTLCLFVLLAFCMPTPNNIAMRIKILPTSLFLKALSRIQTIICSQLFNFIYEKW